VSPSTTITSAIDGNKSIIATGGNSSSNSIAITFSGIDTGGKEDKGVGINHFECSLDGASFSTCISPLELKRLVDGAHTIEVRSSDNVGNNDPSPSSLTWTIDTVPPATSITSALDGNRNTVTTGGNTTSTSMTFTFSGTDVGLGVDHFECSIDGASFSTCTSPVQFNSLSDGAHTLDVRAEDKVTNADLSPASFSWTVDTVPPVTSINTVTDGNKKTLSNGSDTRSNSITLTFSGTDAGKVQVDHFECSIDNSNFVTCTSPFTFPNLLSDGTHTFKVTAEDNSGNKDLSPELFTWKVDTTAPPATINSAFDGNNRTVSNGGNTTSTSMTFTFSGTDVGVGVDHFECSIDGASFSTCSSPLQFNSLSDGSHTLEVRAEDKVGNEGPTPIAFIWTVNTKPPNTTINSVTDGNKNIVTNNSNSRSNTMTFTFSAAGNVAGVDHFECSIDNSNFVTCTSPFTFPNLLSDGTHTFKVRAVDDSGHADLSPESFTWTVDTVPPTTTISSVIDSNKHAITSGGGTSSTSMTFSFSGTDVGAGVDHFECSLDGASFSTCTSPVQFDNLGSGVHTLQVRAEDIVGNKGTSPISFTWSVDATAPDTTINSAVDGNRKTVTDGGNSTSTSMSFTFSGTDLGVGVDHFECSLDGISFSKCDTPLQFNFLSEGAHTLEVRAADKVGNEGQTPTVFLWTVNTTAPTTPQNITTAPTAPQNITTAPTTPTAPQNITTAPTTPTAPQNITTVPQNITTTPTAPQNITTTPTAPQNITTAPQNITTTPTTPTAPQNITTTPTTPTAPQNITTPPTTPTAPQNITTTPTAPQNITTSPFIGGNENVVTNQSTNIPSSVQPLDTSIVSAIDGKKNPVANDGITPSRTIIFVLLASNTGIVEGNAIGMRGFECSLDGASFSSCTSPVEFNGLADGAHILEVRAVDSSGNKDSSPASYTWTVDTTPPDTTINSATDGNNKIITDGSDTLSTSVNFTFSGTDASIEEGEEIGINHFECSIDGSSFTTCTSPSQFENLAKGTHIFEVRAEDNSGNIDSSPSSFTWNVKTILENNTSVSKVTGTPTGTNNSDTIINSSTDGGNNIINNETSTPFNTIKFEFSSINIESTDHFECSMDGSDFVTCTSPFIFPNLSDGKHVFMVRFVDANGNKDESPATFVWEINR
jgi:hypothetical protein